MEGALPHGAAPELVHHGEDGCDLVWSAPKLRGAPAPPDDWLRIEADYQHTDGSWVVAEITAVEPADCVPPSIATVTAQDWETFAAARIDHERRGGGPDIGDMATIVTDRFAQMLRGIGPFDPPDVEPPPYTSFDLISATRTTAVGQACRDEELETVEWELVDDTWLKVKIIRVCELHDDDGAGGGGGGDTPNVTCEQDYWPPGTAPSDDAPVDGGPYVWWRDIEEHEDGSVWGEGYFFCTNLDTDETFEDSWWLCYSACDGADDLDPGDVLDGLIQQAIERVDPPLPGLRHTFDQPADDGTIRAVVNAETWWWAEADHAPIVETDADGPVWVRVTGTPGALTVDPGDGSEPLTCPGLGLPYNRNQSYYDQVPGEPRGACVHVYQQVAESLTATMSVTWTVTYEGSAPGRESVSGALDPRVRQQTATFPVREIQSVIVR